MGPEEMWVITVDITAWCVAHLTHQETKTLIVLTNLFVLHWKGLVQQLQDLDNSPDHCHSQLSMWAQGLTPK